MITTRFFKPFVFLLGLLFFQEMQAQVTEEDSMALVALYHKVPALAGSGTWLNGNVSTWEGVFVLGDRVDGIDFNNLNINDSIPREICALTEISFIGLNGCQLIGNIPSCVIEMPDLVYLGITSNHMTGVEPGTDFSKMNRIQTISIQNNLFSDMPDFLSIPSPTFNNLNVKGNRFNFDDLLPLVNKPQVQYLYDSQQETSAYYQFFVNIGDTADFPDALLTSGGTNNTYHWQALGEGSTVYELSPDRFKNTTTSILRVEGAQPEDNRLYNCEMTNPALPELLLKTGVVFMGVVDPFSAQTIIYSGDTVAYCSDSPLNLIAGSTSGKTVSFVSLNDAVASVNPDNTLSVHQTGEVMIQASVAGDSIYHPAVLDIKISVETPLDLPDFEIVKEMPLGEGDDLHLSVQELPGLQYLWTFPNQETATTSAVTIAPLTTAGLGTYSLKITEGSCEHSALFVSIDELVYGKPIIYELITPNGDGDNETFYIDNLNPAVGNEVTVFNALHQVVYHQHNYRNDWDGGNLPVGTYYYVVRLAQQTYKGNLYIKRE